MLHGIGHTDHDNGTYVVDWCQKRGALMRNASSGATLSCCRRATVSRRGRAPAISKRYRGRHMRRVVCCARHTWAALALHCPSSAARSRNSSAGAADPQTRDTAVKHRSHLAGGQTRPQGDRENANHRAIPLQTLRRSRAVSKCLNHPPGQPSACAQFCAHDASRCGVLAGGYSPHRSPSTKVHAP